MSIASELNNLEGNIEDSYDAVDDMGGVIPAQRNMDNLDQAIRTIPQSQGTTYTAGNGINIDANNVISATTGGVVIYRKLHSSGSYYTLYSDSAQTTTISVANVLDIVESGQVVTLEDTFSRDMLITSARRKPQTGVPNSYQYVFSALYKDETSTTPQIYVIKSYPDYGDGTTANVKITQVFVQEQLTAGSGISINGTTISATAGETVLYTSDDIESVSTATLYTDATLTTSITAGDLYNLSNITIAIDKSNNPVAQYVDYSVIAREYVYDPTQQLEPSISVTMVNQSSGGTIWLTGDYQSSSLTVTRSSGGGNEVTYILTDKNGNVDQSYQMAMQRLMYEDYSAYNVYNGQLQGTWNGSPGSCCLAFASADKHEYLKKNVVENAFASGKTVHIITDLNGYTNQDLVINGSVLAAFPGYTEKVTIAFQHTNVYNAAGIVAIEPRMSAGTDYWVYSGQMS